MARAIGLEIKKCLVAKVTTEDTKNIKEEDKIERKVEKMDLQEEQAAGSSN